MVSVCIGYEFSKNNQNAGNVEIRSLVKAISVQGALIC